MKKRIGSLLLCLLMLVTILSGCGVGKGSSDDEAVIADTQCPNTLDLAQSWDSWFTSRWGITETLYKLDNNLNPQPWLAVSCENKDPNTWVITLRDNVKFQNGKSLTAEAVRRCWLRTEKINPRFSELMEIKDMEANGRTLTIHTEKPVPAMKNQLSDPLTGVVDISSGRNLATHPVGTGPYIAQEYEPNVQATVKRYDGYWRGRPYFKKVTIDILPDTNTMVLAQQNGEIDLSMYVPSSNLSLFQDKKKYIIDKAAGSRAEILYFNFMTTALQEPAIRRALSMCIDKKNYAKIINKDGSAPAEALYPESVYYGKVHGYPFQMRAAARELDRAGIVDRDGDGIRECRGKPVSLRLITYNTRPELPNFANEIAASAKKLGLKIGVEVYDDVSKQESEGDFDLLLMSFTMTPTGDPQYFADMVFRTGGSSNFGKYSSHKVDALVEELDTEFSPERRKELTTQIQREVLADAAFVVIGHSNFICVRKADIQGFFINPSEYYVLDGNIRRGR
ncbi:MAG: ABC transporter substrate-binding protein [Acutalibacteraceae bacterium]|nr:ABC transporter substrate-binding protein [Acutalibacteraceae bacterium]